MSDVSVSKLVKNIESNYLRLNDRPNSPLKSSWIGGISPCHFDDTEDFQWLIKEEFDSIFNMLDVSFGDKDFFIIEDFARVFSENGKNIRLHDNITNSWDDFDRFQHTTDILSFYMIGNNEDWIFWANRDFWLWGAHRSLFLTVASKYITIEKMNENFSTSDDEFKTFMRSLNHY